MANYPSAADYLRARDVEPSAEFYARLEHLRQEAWTLSKISDVEQIEQVKQSLVKALAEGKSFREWQQALTPEMLALPKHYQETVFRTAMISSYNGAKWTHFRAHAERRPVLRYVAINDRRTRPAHHALHGLMMPVDEERWQQLAPPLGFNCFLPGTTVRGEFELGLKSRYTGEAVEITAGTGDRLAVTANHPVLTRRGWLPAHQVKEGDYLLAYGGVVNPLLARVFNDQYPPSPVEDVFETLRANGFGIADIAAFQFHGDAHLRESEVHVAGRDAHLIARMQAAGLHGIEQFHLVGAGARFTGQLAGDSAAQFDMAQRLLFADDAANVAARTANSLCHTTLAAFKYIAVFIKDAFTQGARLFTHSSPRGGQLALRAAGSGFDGEPLDGLRFALTAPCNTMRQQALTDNLTADAVALGETVFTLPGNIGLDDTVYDRIRQDVTGFAETSVAGVRRFHYSGHVYDFQTKNGLIVAGNIVVHNCRCTMVSLSEKQAKALGYNGAPADLPTWEDKHGVSHTAAADKGWGSPERRDLTDYLRQKEAKAGLGKAAYTEPSPPFPTPENWRDVAKMGEEIWEKHSDLLDSVNFDWLQDILPHQMDDAIPERRDEFLNALLAVMKREGVETGAQAKAEGDAVKKFNEIIGRYPASWVNKANSTGTVYIRNLTDRGYHLFIDDRMSLVVKNKRWLNSQGLRVFSKFAEQLQTGDSLLYLNEMTGKEVAYNAARISIHEYGHRLQRTVSGLDDYFKQFWLDRTAGEKTKPLADFAKDKGTSHYSRTEVGREDSFVDGYIGRNYGDDDNPQPREVLTMTFQALLGGDVHLLKKMLDNDREMLYLGVGLLTRFTP
jgi:prophage muMc02, F protein